MHLSIRNPGACLTFSLTASRVDDAVAPIDSARLLGGHLRHSVGLTKLTTSMRGRRVAQHVNELGAHGRLERDRLCLEPLVARRSQIVTLIRTAILSQPVELRVAQSRRPQ